MKICSIDGCNNKHLAKGFCNSHYLRSKRGKNLELKSCYQMDIKERLFSFINMNSNGCWDWIGAKNKKGYGCLSYKNKTTIAHRLSYLLFIGEIPKDLHVLHRCDNPKCINPNHLFLGTDLDNSNDKISKGRFVCSYGKDNGNSKLTDEQVVDIKIKIKKGLSFASISRTYEVSETTIAYIAKNKSWRHING